MRAPKEKFLKNTVSLLAFAFIFFAWQGMAHAATATWTPTSGVNWNTAANWTPNGVPSGTTDVIYSASSTTSSTLNAAVNVKSITITSGYTGTITQSAGITVTAGSGGFSQAGGTFTGSNSAGDFIKVGGSFSLAGGIFTSTRDYLYLPTSTFSGGTFNHNSGIVDFYLTTTNATTSFTVTGSSTFYNVMIGNPAYSGFLTLTLSAGTVLTTQNWFFPAINNNIFLLNGGEIDVQGNILPGHTAYPGRLPSGGTMTVALTGTGTQVVGDISTGVALDFYGIDPTVYDSMVLPNFMINKPSGGVTLSSLGTPSVADINRILITGNWTNQNATPITVGTSSVVMLSVQTGDGTATTSSPGNIITGSSSFYGLYFYNLWPKSAFSSNPGIYFTVATGTVLSVSGPMDIDYNGAMLSFAGGGEIDVKGDLLAMGFPNSGSSNEFIPTNDFANLIVNGTGAQTIGTGVVDSSELWLQSIHINKSSGSINLGGTAGPGVIRILNNWTNDNGPSILSAGTSTVEFGGTSSTITGSSTFYNLGFGFPYSATNSRLTVVAGTVITAQGGTYITTHYDVGPIFLGGGEVDAQGDVLLGEPAAPNGGIFWPANAPTSTFNFVMNGPGDQIINDQGQTIYDPGNYSYQAFPFQGLTINKPSGVVTVSSTFTYIANGLTVTKGELRLSGAKYFEVDGAVTVASGGLFSAYPAATSTILFGSSLTNNGTVFFSGDGFGCTLPLPVNVTLRSTSTGVQVPWSGSGFNLMRYVDAKDQSASVGNPITVWNGVNSGNNSNWTFSNGNGRPQLVQAAAVQGTSGTPPSTLTFPAYPRAGDLVLVAIASQNNAIAAPSDNAGNAYSLVSANSFGSPTRYLNLYYAKNIAATSTFIVTLNGTSSAPGTYLSAGAYEYTGMAPSSTFVASSTNSDTITSTSTQITSLSAVGVSTNQLYFGAAVVDNSSATLSPSWTSEFPNTCGASCLSLYVQDLSTSTIMTTAATWTSTATTSYTATIGIFRSIYTLGYAASGTLDSATFDTGVASGTQLNSIVWQGTASNGTAVKFQVAVSSSTGGPWNFIGPSGDGSQYFSGNPGTPISLASTNGGFNLFNGYRYFRYRVVLFSDITQTYSPTVSQVSVNWSP